ncbi:MAG: polysaccharide biosynthesis/export family protein, partial [Pirellulaceae bacterium]
MKRRLASWLLLVAGTIVLGTLSCPWFRGASHPRVAVRGASVEARDVPALEGGVELKSSPRQFAAALARAAHAVSSQDVPARAADAAVALCQFCPPPTRVLKGVDASSCRPPCGEPSWRSAHPLSWEQFAQGEYLGPARSPHVGEYRLRVDDELEFVYRFTHEEIVGKYRLVVGDEIVIESFSEDEELAIRRGDISLGRGLTVQPDGTINMPWIDPVPVIGRTLQEVEDELENQYQVFLKNPRFSVTPLKTNTKLEDLRSAVDARFGSGGQTRSAVVSPDGTVQLVGLASVPAQGLTMDELQAEVNARYEQLVGRGVEVTVTLRQRAPRFVWVVGEVNQPGQYELNQPITAIQALALARGFINGGNVREIVVFRRDDNWQLMATRLDIRGVF